MGGVGLQGQMAAWQVPEGRSLRWKKGSGLSYLAIVS